MNYPVRLPLTATERARRAAVLSANRAPIANDLAQHPDNSHAGEISSVSISAEQTNADSAKPPDVHEPNEDRLYGQRAAQILRNCRRDVALASTTEEKIAAFRMIAGTLTEAVSAQWLPKDVMVDRLLDIAAAHNSFGFGPERIQQIISEVIRAVCPPIRKAATIGAWKSSAVTAEVLRTKQFPIPQIILPGLICEGVTILASKPKVGKSWLALDVCIATAANRFTLGTLRPKTGDVLYLALEDSQRRLQRRVNRILSAVSEAWPARLTMATDWRRVDQGGLDDIREWCDGVPEPKLIVIDTLAKIRPAKGSNKAAYDVDYEVIAGLHQIANGRGIAILIIHHTRKMEADDAFDTVSGTLGLTGAADTILVLNKRAGVVTLHARGRDIEESETALQFNKETCRWTILGAAREVQRSNERSRVIEALTGASDGMSVKHIMAHAEFTSRGAVDVLLSKMVAAREIERSGRGYYKLPSSQSSDAGKIGEKEGSTSQTADLATENDDLTNLTNPTGDLSCPLGTAT